MHSLIWRRKSMSFLFVCCPTLLASKVCSQKHVIASVCVALARVQSEFAILWFLWRRQTIDVIPKFCKWSALLLKSNWFKKLEFCNQSCVDIQGFPCRVPQLTCIWMSLPGASGLGNLTSGNLCFQEDTNCFMFFQRV